MKGDKQIYYNNEAGFIEAYKLDKSSQITGCSVAVTR